MKINIRPIMLKVLTIIFAVYSIIFLAIIVLQYNLQNDIEGRCKRICGKSQVLSCEYPWLVCYEKINGKGQRWFIDFDFVNKID